VGGEVRILASHLGETMSSLGFVKAAKLVDAVTTTHTSDSNKAKSDIRSYQAYGSTSAGAGSATIVVEVSNVDLDNTWMVIGTITLTLGTTVTADGFTIESPWTYTRVRVSAISGTDATVSVYMGYQDK
jgi:hypothetical protein